MNFKVHKLTRYLGRVSVKCQELIKDYQPVYMNPFKKEIFSKALFSHRKQRGIIKISRVTFNRERPEILLEKNPLKIRTIPQFYDYTQDKNTEARFVWYVNFADPLLFGYYDCNAFAQDEIQTLEMPLLASSMIYLDKKQFDGLKTNTVVIDNSSGFPQKCATPYLFENVPYWISVNTNPVLKDGTTANLYGQNFRRSSKEALEAGIKIYQPELKTNIIAIAAPACGNGTYTREQLQLILETLISSFGGAVKQSKLARRTTTVIHSGNWGCGAFGSNRELMYLCQIYAASVCGVDEIIFHSASKEILNAHEKVNHIEEKAAVSQAVEYLYAQKYQWNISDNN